jgi:hypothetical protein
MPTTSFRSKMKGTDTGCNRPSPRHSGNQDETVHPPLDSANCSEKDGLERAIGQYHDALQHWEFGNVQIPKLSQELHRRHRHQKVAPKARAGQSPGPLDT